MKTDAELMADIVAKVGDAQARQMVISAYNTEILSNRLGRLEQRQGTPQLSKGKTNLMHLALVRVHEVITLGD